MTQSPSKPSWLGRLLGSQAPGPLQHIQVLNVTRGTEIGGRIEVAGTAGRRNKGLLGRSGLEPGEGLWIVPCEAVHTFAMKFAIDLIYLDRKHRVVKLRQAVRPGRISAALRAHSVLELPPGAISASRTCKGDWLQLNRVGENEPVGAGALASTPDRR